MTSKTGPIILIEQDKDDQEITISALEEIGVENTVQFFSMAEQALDYLQGTKEKPFLILCEIMLSPVNGLELQKRIHESEYLRKKCIPLIFYSAVDDQSKINQAFDHTIQGYFQKPYSFDDLKDILHYIIGYWKRSELPDSL